MQPGGGFALSMIGCVARLTTATPLEAKPLTGNPITHRVHDKVHMLKVYLLTRGAVIHPQGLLLSSSSSSSKAPNGVGASLI